MEKTKEHKLTAQKLIRRLLFLYILIVGVFRTF